MIIILLTLRLITYSKRSFRLSARGKLIILTKSRSHVTNNIIRITCSTGFECGV